MSEQVRYRTTIKRGGDSVLITRHGENIWMTVPSAPYIKPRDYKTEALAVAAAKKWLRIK